MLKFMAGVSDKYANNTERNIHVSAVMHRVCALVMNVCAMPAESLLFFIKCLSCIKLRYMNLYYARCLCCSLIIVGKSVWVAINAIPQ